MAVEGQQHGLVSDLFRAVNERIRELREPATGECDFVCECNDEDCMHVMHMTIPEYDSARSDPEQFAVLPGHQLPGSESVISRGDRFVLVKAM
jgi:hypothetical protein